VAKEKKKRPLPVFKEGGKLFIDLTLDTDDVQEQMQFTLTKDCHQPLPNNCYSLVLDVTQKWTPNERQKVVLKALQVILKNDTCLEAPLADTYYREKLKHFDKRIWTDKRPLEINNRRV